jgi:hypothetical protein
VPGLRDRLIVDPPDPRGSDLATLLVVLWHGAGGDVDERGLTAVARGLAAAGAIVVRARFPYRLAGRRAPDRMPTLIESAREAVEDARGLPGAGGRRLVLGGRSMGGRVASMLVAGGQAADGLLFLSYPLHPAGQREKLRVEHLPRICCPMLFVQGDRDSLCDLSLLGPIIEKLGERARVWIFPGADHSLRVPADELVAAALTWATDIAATRRSSRR